MTNQDVLVIYTADDMPQAAMVQEFLKDRSIDAFVEPTASPFDGLTSIGQGTSVMVRSGDAARARSAITEFLNEHAEPTETD